MSQAPAKYLSSGDGPGNPESPSKTQSGLAAGQNNNMLLARAAEPLSPGIPPAAKATGSAKVGTGWC